jgi:hypothetical protein
MKPLKFALILVCSLLATRLSAGERLVYAVTHGGAGNTATGIFSIAPGDAQPTRIFSDVSSPVALGFNPQFGTSAPFETAVIGSRLFAPGVAYVQQLPSKYVGKNYIVSPEHVWIQPLPVGDAKEMLSLETGQERVTFLTLIGWMGE